MTNFEQVIAEMSLLGVGVTIENYLSFTAFKHFQLNHCLNYFA